MTAAIKSAISHFAQPDPDPNTNAIRFLDERRASMLIHYLVEKIRLRLFLKDERDFDGLLANPSGERPAGGRDFIVDFERHFDAAGGRLFEKPFPKLRDLLETVIIFVRADQDVGIEKVEQRFYPRSWLGRPRLDSKLRSSGSTSPGLTPRTFAALVSVIVSPRTPRRTTSSKALPSLYCLTR